VTPTLPATPSLEYHKKTAKQLLAAHKKGDPSGLEIMQLHGAFAGMSEAEILSAQLSLAQIQHAIAKSYGFRNWAEFRARLLRRSESSVESAGTRAIQRDAAAEEEIRQILRDKVGDNDDHVGMVIGIVSDQGRRVFSRGASDGRPVDGDTLFGVGAVASLFAAGGLCSMVRSDEMGLSDPASMYLPPSVRLPLKNGREITLLELASHSSGLPGYQDQDVYTPQALADPWRGFTVEIMYDILKTCRVDSDLRSYCGVGLSALSHILSLHAGVSYDGLVASRILNPLGMASTCIRPTEHFGDRIAAGHHYGGKRAPLELIPSFAAGADGYFSTVNDMLSFLSAQLGLCGSSLTPALRLSQEAIPKSCDAVETNGPSTGRCLGWWCSEKGGDTLHWLFGHDAGYSASIAMSTTHKIGVVALRNCDHQFIRDVAPHLADPRYRLSNAQDPAAGHTEVSVDNAILELYVGEYQMVGSRFCIAVFLKEGSLWGQGQAQQALRMFPESQTQFFYKAIDAQISFHRSDTGEVSRMILHQDTFQHEMTRIEPLR
jgi:D-alanyl-D-alanine-carboxypeptidase/D-alanyl-D-alanine-endopeptidase